MAVLAIWDVVAMRGVVVGVVEMLDVVVDVVAMRGAVVDVVVAVVVGAHVATRRFGLEWPVSTFL